MLMAKLCQNNSNDWLFIYIYYFLSVCVIILIFIAINQKSLEPFVMLTAFCTNGKALLMVGITDTQSTPLMPVFIKLCVFKYVWTAFKKNYIHTVLQKIGCDCLLVHTCNELLYGIILYYFILFIFLLHFYVFV